ncbi:hypothetical protein, partial [Frigoribacterium sp. Leaf164]|uniref:hypothetical protein n=1 Tax=Frigoribacterium sp. Leaf164 TaxID=1736282 RepID=UPI001F4049F3
RTLHGDERPRHGRTGTAPPPRTVDNSCCVVAGAAPTRLARPGAGGADARRAPPSVLGRDGTGTAPPPRTVANSCDVLAGAGDPPRARP